MSTTDIVAVRHGHTSDPTSTCSVSQYGRVIAARFLASCSACSSPGQAARQDGIHSATQDAQTCPRRCQCQSTTSSLCSSPSPRSLTRNEHQIVELQANTFVQRVRGESSSSSGDSRNVAKGVRALGWSCSVRPQMSDCPLHTATSRASVSPIEPGSRSVL